MAVIGDQRLILIGEVYRLVSPTARSSTPRGATNAGLEPRHFLNLLGELEGVASRLTRNLLLVFSGGISGKQSSAELVMMLLVGLNLVTIKRRRFTVAARFAEFDEALIPNQRDPFAGKLARGHTSGCALELAKILKQWGVATFSRIGFLGINPERLESLSN